MTTDGDDQALKNLSSGFVSLGESLIDADCVTDGEIDIFPVNLVCHSKLNSSRWRLFKASSEEVDEDGVGIKWATLVFGVELDTEEKRVNSGGKFDGLNQATIWRSAADNKSALCKNFLKFVVEFITVSVSLGDDQRFTFLIDFGQKSVGLDLARVCTEANSATVVTFGKVFFLVFHEMDDGIVCFWIDFFGVGVFQASDVSGKLNRRQLHPKTEAQIGNFVFPSIFYGGDDPFCPPPSPSLRDDDTGDIGEIFFRMVANFTTIDTDQVYDYTQTSAGVTDGLQNTDVDVLVVVLPVMNVLANQCDFDSLLGVG